MKKIITISREFGAAGTTIAKELGERIGYEYYDKAIVLHAYQNYHMDIEDLVKFDEKVPASFSFAYSWFEKKANAGKADQLFEAQEKTIRDIAEHGHCIILGRNANAILKEYDSVFNVFLYADEKWRLEFLKNRTSDWDEKTIREMIKKIDREKAKYYQYNTGGDFTKMNNYDICLNVGYFGVDQTVDILEHLIRNEDTQDAKD